MKRLDPAARAARREYVRAYMAKRYHTMKRLGLCVSCSRLKEPRQKVYVRCLRCAKDQARKQRERSRRPLVGQAKLRGAA